MARSVFYKIPPEIWEGVVAQVGKCDLAALALASKETYPVANRLLYRTLEISFCKCSESYYVSLTRTITHNPELAALIVHLLIDMKVPCKVKTTSSVDNVSSRSWRHLNPYVLAGMVALRGYEHPKGQANWSREAVQALSNPLLFVILSHLFNVERITVILGHFQQNSEVLSSLITSLPGGILEALQCLKVYDTSLISSPLTSTSSLRVLDLGYVTADNAELCTVVSQNAGTLEEIRFQCVMEPRQAPLFADYSGPTIKNLKTFSSEGPYAFSSPGLRKLLGEAPMLEELQLKSQSIPSVAVWAQIFSDLTVDDKWRAGRMRIFRAGASTGCSEFWDSVVKLLCRCGNGLTSLYINGMSRGSIGPFPPSLLDYFSNYPQPRLDSLVLMWRDDTGLPSRSAITLASFAPNLELFHACLPYPLDTANSLLGIISPFPKLCRVHLTFLKYARTYGPAQYPIFHHEMMREIELEGPIFWKFTQNAAARHPKLTEVSWSVYDRSTYSGDGPKAYVKINRSSTVGTGAPDSTATQRNNNPNITLTDLKKECLRCETANSPRYRCTVGTKKVLLSQKPSWREDMGNPFVESHRVCPYAEFNDASETLTVTREL